MNINVYVTLFLFVSTCIMSTLMWNIHSTLKKLLTADELPSTSPTKHSSFDSKELTSYEMELLERNEAFDKRIKNLQDELINTRDAVRRGTVASELHPLVHNLPHDAVQTKYDLDNYEEVAE